VGVFPNPIMPGLTDSERSLDGLARAARQAGALTFGGGPLFLKPCAQAVMLPFLDREFPELAPRYRELYATSAFLGKPYKEALAARVQRVRDRYGLAAGMIEYRPELWEGEEQGELFPIQ
jgi:DNA repair photolyase